MYVFLSMPAYTAWHLFRWLRRHYVLVESGRTDLHSSNNNKTTWLYILDATATDLVTRQPKKRDRCSSTKKKEEEDLWHEIVDLFSRPLKERFLVIFSLSPFFPSLSPPLPRLKMLIKGSFFSCQYLTGQLLACLAFSWQGSEGILLSARAGLTSSVHAYCKIQRAF